MGFRLAQGDLCSMTLRSEEHSSSQRTGTLYPYNTWSHITMTDDENFYLYTGIGKRFWPDAFIWNPNLEKFVLMIGLRYMVLPKNYFPIKI